MGLLGLLVCGLNIVAGSSCVTCVLSVLYVL